MIPKFDKDKINNFSNIRPFAKLTIVLIWNALFFLELACVLEWDMTNAERFQDPNYLPKLSGFIVIAFALMFLLTRHTQTNKALEKWLFKDGSPASDNIDMLNFIGLISGILMIGSFVFTLVSRF